MAELKSYSIEVIESGGKNKYHIQPLAKLAQDEGPHWKCKEFPGLKFLTKKGVEHFFNRRFGKENINVK